MRECGLERGGSLFGPSRCSSHPPRFCCARVCAPLYPIPFLCFRHSCVCCRWCGWYLPMRLSRCSCRWLPRGGPLSCPLCARACVCVHSLRTLNATLSDTPLRLSRAVHAGEYELHVMIGQASSNTHCTAQHTAQHAASKHSTTQHSPYCSLSTAPLCVCVCAAVDTESDTRFTICDLRTPILPRHLTL